MRVLLLRWPARKLERARMTMLAPTLPERLWSQLSIAAAT
jgi:hypothetical protein